MTGRGVRMAGSGLHVPPSTTNGGSEDAAVKTSYSTRLTIRYQLEQDPRHGAAGELVRMPDRRAGAPDQRAVAGDRLLVCGIARRDHLAHESFVGRLHHPAERLRPPVSEHMRLGGVHGDLKVKGHRCRVLSLGTGL